MNLECRQSCISKNLSRFGGGLRASSLAEIKGFFAPLHDPIGGRL